MDLIASILRNFASEPLFMLAILGISILGGSIAVERVRYLLAIGDLKKDEFLGRVQQQILAGHLDKAISLCSQKESPLTNIVKAGLMAVANDKGADEVQTAMDAVALREIPRLERRTGLLALLSNLATLVGLLGTISGLVGAFIALGAAHPGEKAALLSRNIVMAMSCTAFGLLVAVLLLGAYGYIQTRTQELVDDVHEAAVATLHFILANREKFGGKP